eukprot:SAG11_NODE_2506_length_3275_cov_2.399559_2_plen_279_part_00
MRQWLCSDWRRWRSSPTTQGLEPKPARPVHARGCAVCGLVARGRGRARPLVPPARRALLGAAQRQCAGLQGLHGRDDCQDLQEEGGGFGGGGGGGAGAAAAGGESSCARAGDRDRAADADGPLAGRRPARRLVGAGAGLAAAPDDGHQRSADHPRRRIARRAVERPPRCARCQTRRHGPALRDIIVGSLLSLLPITPLPPLPHGARNREREKNRPFFCWRAHHGARRELGSRQAGQGWARAGRCTARPCAQALRPFCSRRLIFWEVQRAESLHRLELE